jgi:hypothetical protein
MSAGEHGNAIEKEKFSRRKKKKKRTENKWVMK